MPTHEQEEQQKLKRLELKNKLRNKINSFRFSRNSENSHEVLLRDEYKVPEDMIEPILDFVKLHKILPFSVDALKKFKDLPEDERSKIISSLQFKK